MVVEFLISISNTDSRVLITSLALVALTALTAEFPQRLSEGATRLCCLERLEKVADSRLTFAACFLTRRLQSPGVNLRTYGGTIGSAKRHISRNLERHAKNGKRTWRRR